MFIGNKALVNKIGDQNISMSGVQLERVKVFKYLGLWLDEGLTFDHHVTKTYNKVCQKLGAIRKVRNCLGQSMALRLYKSLVIPHFDYCSSVYMCANKETLQRLQLVQNIGCRTILKAGRRTPIVDMHRQLGLMPLDERRDIQLSQLCHKNVFPKETQCLSKYFVPARIVGGRRTRAVSSNNMIVPRLKTEKGKHAIAYRGPNHWNHMDNSLKAIERYESFKRELMKKSSMELDNHPT